MHTQNVQTKSPSLLQYSVIQNYFQAFGKKKLEQVAFDTGIQISRVFRILKKGQEMRISEYESFKKCIHQNKYTGLQQRFSEISHFCLELLSSDCIEEILYFMENRLDAKRIKFEIVATQKSEKEKVKRKEAVK